MGHEIAVDIPEPLLRDHLDDVVRYHVGCHQHTLPGDSHHYYSEHLHHFVRQHEHEVCDFFWSQYHRGILRASIGRRVDGEDVYTGHIFVFLRSDIGEAHISKSFKLILRLHLS